MEIQEVYLFNLMTIGISSMFCPKSGGAFTLSWLIGFRLIPRGHAPFLQTISRASKYQAKWYIREGVFDATAQQSLNQELMFCFELLVESAPRSPPQSYSRIMVSKLPLNLRMALYLIIRLDKQWHCLVTFIKQRLRFSSLHHSKADCGMRCFRSAARQTRPLDPTGLHRSSLHADVATGSGRHVLFVQPRYF
jgi:hypothetical protein